MTSNLIVRSAFPLNAEPPLERLRAVFLTAEPDFYVRSHGAVPEIDPAQYRLAIDGLVTQPLRLSLDELTARFTPRTVTAVMQCAGNRRGELQSVRPTAGDPWGPGAIGNAEWTGVALADLLAAAGAQTDPALHVHFDSIDRVQGGELFGVSIPMQKALCSEVIVAWAMNGAALAPEHGFPLRAVVPGYAGIRSAKWLGTVTVAAAPSANAMQQHDYKLFPSHVTEETADWRHGLTINEMPLNAAICDPACGAVLDSGALTVRGYAVVSGRTIARVEVSTDGGGTWQEAELEPNPAPGWSWTLWHCTLALPPGDHELSVRAWDSAGQTQPARLEDVWNFKGYLCASWHRVRVTIRK